MCPVSTPDIECIDSIDFPILPIKLPDIEMRNEDQTRIKHCSKSSSNDLEGGPKLGSCLS